MLLRAEHIYKVYHDRPVLEDISLQIEDTDRIALVGVNGCGKSTLLKILLGEVLPDHQKEGDGAVVRAAKASVGYLAQSAALDSEATVREEMRSVFSELLLAQQRMRELEPSLEDPANAAEYDRLSAWFEANDGYLFEVKIRTVLYGMGFPEEVHGRKISSFSGGEKTRLALAKLLLEAPNLLVLDEPTNHLDFDTIQWLETYLSDYRGALLIVSHDRYFLQKLCTSVCEIENGHLTRYKGDFRSYTVQRAANRERQEKEYALQQKEIARLEDYVARNMARASTSKSAKSRQKQLDRMERIEKPVAEEKRSFLHFTYETEPPLEVLDVRDADISVGAGAKRRQLLSHVSFSLRRGERLGIIGANGIGKTTLLRELLGKLPHTGQIRWGKNTKLAYFDQEASEFNPLNTVIDELHDRFPALRNEELRHLLGQVRITGDAVLKPVSALSGGERARLCLALLMLEQGNVMLLDEPTNHLDMSMKEVLEEALAAYTGTLIFVSHDRYFLDRLATCLLELTPEGAVWHPDGFGAYMEERAAAMAAVRPDKKPVKEKSASAHRTKENRSAQAQKRQRTRELEREIEALDARLKELEGEMQEAGGDYQRIEALCAEMETARARSDECFEALCVLEEEGS